MRRRAVHQQGVALPRARPGGGSDRAISGSRSTPAKRCLPLARLRFRDGRRRLPTERLQAGLALRKWRARLLGRFVGLAIGPVVATLPIGPLILHLASARALAAYLGPRGSSSVRQTGCGLALVRVGGPSDDVGRGVCTAWHCWGSLFFPPAVDDTAVRPNAAGRATGPPRADRSRTVGGDMIPELRHGGISRGSVAAWQYDPLTSTSARLAKCARQIGEPCP